ncbi:hypothetical protein COSHB9_12990 [Companilactobacillus alimentarius]|uniref:S-layer protein C-terminal domain-containing protein n=1 Tax=Companilactobacillus alimentarius DSM 20249 TaxID=1423720 RepID=A0A2K9HPJ1_9LACO|nr:SLAP domain-containing protein [Companilactobacillus alimentarius]AUI71292.1 hypothetical protein LA20249_03350 [Companilactobacillus alimentarius DSM 20249]KRK75432.1 teichoic acid-binding N-acetylmuramoyl L-alalanine amidase [Companilactobacillus alimentarius DSM 20249]MDT6951427.1 SLAP domain-containing protein [Companilactobacillus alimentarius]GEO43783.1 hypothetical protein LAL01_00150 [Companilactobacillus alimentarius]
MKKNKILLASTLAVLIAPSVLNNASYEPEASVQAATTTVDSIKTPIGTVDYGGAYTVDANGNQTSLYLSGKSSWKLGKSVLINGSRYYEVATNKYISSDHITLTDGLPTTSSVIKPAVPNQVGTLNTAGKVFDINGNFNGVVLPASSSWKLGQLVNINGNAYYQVATNEYVLAGNVIINSTSGTSINTVITLNNASRIVDDNGNYTGKTLPAYSSWKADRTKTMYNVTYYRVATNQWVSNVPIKSYSLVANLKSSQAVYNTETNSMTRSLPAGSSWKFNKVVRNKNNQFWGKVSTNEWLLLDSNVSMSYGDSDTVPSVAVSEPEFATNLNN